MMRFIGKVAVGVVILAALLVLAVGALLFSDAPIVDVMREMWRVFVYWWKWPEDSRRRLACRR